MNKSLQMGTKIGLGFLFTTIVLVVIAAATLVQVGRTTILTSELIERDQPVAEELKSTIQEFVDRARAVREAAEEMSKRAGIGLNLTQAAALKNDDVRMSFEAAGGSILKLSQQMQQITQITMSVNEIAEQTTDAMRQMDHAARQQESGMSDLVTGIAEVDAGSKETLTTAQQTQKAIAAIEQRSKELSKIVARLKR